MNYYLKEIVTLKNTGNNVIPIKRIPRKKYEDCLRRIREALKEINK
jgi:hypothetical protein